MNPPPLLRLLSSRPLPLRERPVLDCTPSISHLRSDSNGPGVPAMSGKDFPSASADRRVQ